MTVTPELTREKQPLDVLIVGGGPGGTAAAFRARELGLSALVIDYDDLLKRIRDYAKDKLILPDFGGGDSMRFPKGGSLFALLQFEPIDKDQMCVLWKRHYTENEIPHEVGIELLGLERESDGVWNVKAWNHKIKAPTSYLARHVVLGIGRGVPRRFDIPGNTDGIAFRLEDPKAYVGRPAIVIGGGTSAAEAVIAISGTKLKEGDTTGVYWSYRGDRLPRVSKALADVFFEAHVANGNISYFPRSEPTAVVTGDDRAEYLDVRVDRKDIPGRPCETTHLEFPKECCVACIGEDIPEAFLKSMGISMAVGGPLAKKRMVVTRHLETQQPNVYLIGDILSQAYFETDDFDADPAGFREVKHLGNIKSALKDGLLVVEVIRQKLEGKDVGDVVLDYVDSKIIPPSATIQVPAPVESPGPPVASIEPNRRVEEARAWLIRILPGSVEENQYPLKPDGVTTIGRTGCDIDFSDDTLLSEKHASISRIDDAYYLRDDGSATGVYLRAQGARTIEITPGDLVRLGRQFLRLWEVDGTLQLIHFDEHGNEKNRYPVGDKNRVLGRQAPDITLDSKDMTLSRNHLAILAKDGKILIRDLKSANGTYLKVRNQVKLEDRDQFRVGRQLFVFTLNQDAVLDRGYTAPAPGVAAAVLSAVRTATSLPGTIAVESAPAMVEPERTGAAPSAPPTTLGEFVTPEKQTTAAAEVAEVALAQAPPEAAPAQAASEAAPAQAPPEPTPTPAQAPTGIAVTFKGLDKTFYLKPGQSICELAEENGVEINADCHQGSCGSDPIRIVSGQENMNEIGTSEKEALEDVCSLAPGPHRLACVAKPKGPVVVEIIQS